MSDVCVCVPISIQPSCRVNGAMVHSDPFYHVYSDAYSKALKAVTTFHTHIFQITELVCLGSESINYKTGCSF